MNKSEIARRFNCSWKTVDRKINPEKYVKPKKDIVKVKPRILQPYEEIIKQKLEAECMNSTALHYFLTKKFDFKGSASTVRKFIAKYKQENINVATIRFETLPGYQMQVDWKEMLTLHDKSR